MQRMSSVTLYVMMILLLSLFALTACGSTAPENAGESDAENGANNAVPNNNVISDETTEAVEGELNFYTSQPDADAAALVEAFNKEYPDVEVNTFRSGTEEVISRLLAEAEAGSVQADILLVADAPTFVELRNRDLLMPYMSPEAAHIPEDLYDPQGYYYGTKAMATALVVNTQNVSDMPDSWKELIDPAKKGRSIMPSPNYSGAAAYNLGVLTRQDGFGWEFYEQLATNEVSLTQGNGDVLQRVASGEKDYGMVVDFIVARAINEGSPVALIYPQEGVPVITEPVGIVKDSPNPEAAKVFVDFVLSKEGQQLAVDIGYMPIRQGVEPPAGLPTIEEMNIVSADVEELASSREADKERFGEIMGE